jgi:glyoxylase-like metal-dependent hydrolase (beta-lactamase superfamily II)
VTSRRRLLQTLPLLAAPAFAAASKGVRWSVITIGNLSRNRYWGESDAKGLRSAICTCTLISGHGFQLLMDPSLANKDEMAKELDRRTGRKLDDVTAVFISHEHPDHYAGLEHFPKAAWFAAPPIAQMLNGAKTFTRPLESAPSKLFDTIEVMATPGHSPGHHSLRFTSEEHRVVAAADAVMTRDFFLARTGYFASSDLTQASRTVEMLAHAADIIIPGHDNYFYV